MGLSFRNIGRNIRDIFDANTEADQQRRIKAGQPRMYEAQQKAAAAWRAPMKAPVAPNRNLFSKLYDQVNIYDNNRTFKQATPTASRSNFNQFQRNANTAAHGIARSTFGIGSDVSGFADLATPGHGINRFTKTMNRFNEDIDKHVKDRGYSTGLYKGSQGVHQGASFMVPGMVLSKPAKATTVAAKNASNFSKVAKWAVKPETLINVGTDAAQNAGFRTARGQDNSPLTAATDIGASYVLGGTLEAAAKPVMRQASKVVSKLTQDVQLTPKQLAKRNYWVQVHNNAELKNKPGIMNRASKEIDKIDASVRAPVKRLVDKSVRAVSADGPNAYGQTPEGRKQLADQIKIEERRAKLNGNEAFVKTIQDGASSPQRHLEELQILNGSKEVDADVLQVQAAAQRAAKEGDMESARMLNESLPPEDRVLLHDLTKTSDKPKVQLTEPEKPKVTRASDGQPVDTTTGEIIDTSPRAIKDLPHYKDATSADMPVIESSMEATKKSFDDWGSRYTPEQRKTYAVEVANHSRDGTPLSPQTQKMYDEIRQIVDDMFDNSRSLEGAERTFDTYMPEHRPGETGERIPFGDSFVDDVNSSLEAANKREFKIDPDELDDPVNLYKNHTEQWFYDNYSDVRAAQNPHLQSELDDPLTYVKGRKEVAQGLADKVDGKPVADDAMLTDKIQANYRENGGKNVIKVDTELPHGTRARTERNLLKKTAIYENSGLNRYENAAGVASQIYEDVFVDIDDLSLKQLTDRMQTEFGGKLDDTDGETGVIAKYAREVWQNKGDPLAQKAKFQALEESLAGQQVFNFAERAEFRDPKVKELFNQNAEYVLASSRRNMNMADKTARAVTEMFHLGYLGLKPFSAAQNLTETSRTFGLTGAKNALRAYKDLITGKVKKNDILARYGQDRQYLDQLGNMPTQYQPTKGDKFKGGIMWLFQKSEEIKDAHMLRALELESDAMKLTGREQANYVMNKYNDHAIKYGNFGSLHGAKKSPLERSAWQFTQYPLKDWGITGKYMKDAVTGTKAEQKAAIKYLTRTGGAKLVMMAPMYAVFGAGVSSLFNLNAPKGGPVLSVPGAIMDAIMDESQTAEAEDREMNWGNVWKRGAQKNVLPGMVPGGSYLFNTVGVQEFIPGLKEGDSLDGVLRHDNAVGDLKRGYNENKAGRARFTTPDDIVGQGKMLLGGAYNTTNAKEYFGSSPFDAKIPGMTVPFTDTDKTKPGNQNYQFSDIGFSPNKTGKYSNFNPVNDRYQEQVEASKNKGEVKDIIAKSREAQARNKTFYESPQGKAWSALNSTVYNPDTKKYESDVVSPEKWKGVQADKSGTTYTQLRDAAKQRQRDFGDPLDPIFSDKWSKYKTELMTMRSQFTGDDKEMKDIANATQPWYKEYMKDYISYIDKIKNRDYKEDDTYGQSARVKQYWDLTAKNPAIPENTNPIITKYYDIKNKDPEAAKSFFKANADQLSAAFDKQTQDKFKWTNQMRALEGAQPLPWDVFQNITFGYEADEASVYRQLGYKLRGSGGGGGSSGGGYSRGVSLNAMGDPLKVKLSVKQPAKAKSKKDYKKAPPKVSLKKSLV